jgi:hypothetical protein
MAMITPAKTTKPEMITTSSADHDDSLLPWASGVPHSIREMLINGAHRGIVLDAPMSALAGLAASRYRIQKYLALDIARNWDP